MPDQFLPVIINKIKGPVVIVLGNAVPGTIEKISAADTGLVVGHWLEHPAGTQIEQQVVQLPASDIGFFVLKVANLIFQPKLTIPDHAERQVAVIQGQPLVRAERSRYILLFESGLRFLKLLHPEFVL